MSAKVCFVVVALFVLCGVTFAKNLDSSRSKRATTTGSDTCLNLKPFFQSRNISLSTTDNKKGSICGGQCCDDKTEELLRKQGQKDFAALLSHNSRTLQGLLNSTSSLIQNHVSELSHVSQNQTLLVFSKVYRGMAVLSRQPIETLYSGIRDYIHIESVDSNTSENITETVTRFFTDLFPLAYHFSPSISTSTKDFSLRYKQCLKENMDTIAPFGDIPKQTAQSLSKSLEATRSLLQAFRIGIEVLNTTDMLLLDQYDLSNTECHNALLKMTYCPKCLALTKNTKPCSGYCLNVLRGCTAKYVAELDLPWNGYVEGVEGLVSAMKKSSNDADTNVDTVIKDLDSKISAAIMYSMEKISDIDSRVKQSCKTAEFSQKEDPLMVENSTPLPASVSGKSRQSNSRSFPPFPETHLSLFLTSIAKTKGFYATLANTLCQDESFAEQKDRRCWNGERIAEYTKTVVDVGLDMQKYNPEVKATPNLQNVDPKVANLVDKLRHVQRMVGPNHSDTDYMQRDGVDGSGSGSGPDFEDADDEYTRGSGSGHGPVEQDETGTSSQGDNIDVDEQKTTKVRTSVNQNVPHASSSCITPPVFLLNFAIMIALAARYN